MDVLRRAFAALTVLNIHLEEQVLGCRAWPVAACNKLEAEESALDRTVEQHGLPCRLQAHLLG